jgi:arylsulfatase A-like enzyme
MRILYIDIDSLRPDHLGCYGYHRATSPNIDALARESVRFEHCYVSDAPCLPSRTALWSGRFGFRTGVVGHGRRAAQPFSQPDRGFTDLFSRTSWTAVLRAGGFHTASVSSFPQRHSAWHWYAGFHDVLDPGGGGVEIAPAVNRRALEWLGAHAREDTWFLHVNYWDPHTPYRTPLDYGEPFTDDAPPAWITEEVRQRLWEGYGPHSAQEPHGFVPPRGERYPRMPDAIDSMEAVKRWFDGYDTGIRYADELIGRLLNTLADAGVLDETAIIVSADHGESQGELNVWGDHQTADHIASRVPLIVRWPGVESRVDTALHYQVDWAATLLELAGAQVPEEWDGQPFTDAFRAGSEEGRSSLVLGQGAWTCMRSVRWDRYLCLRTYHDGYLQLSPLMLFDVCDDPHQQHDLAPERSDLTDHAMALLTDWQRTMMLRSGTDVDPLMTVLRQGGPWQVQGYLRAYVDRLCATGREHAARHLELEHSSELEP